MNQFFSKRNQVYPTLQNGCAAVEKHFAKMEDWQWETALYAVLEDRLPLLKVLESAPGLLVTAYAPSPTLLEELHRQEREGFSPAPWHALADWIISCHGLCGRLPSEGNIRNFLWNEAEQQVVGLDLENFREDTISACGARLIAWLQCYAPEGTAVKAEAIAVLAERMYVSAEAVAITSTRLLEYRRSHILDPISGIILAGGHSSRMGKDKASLLLCGKTLLEWQIEKLRVLGVEDIIVSGADAPEGTRRIEDIYPDRGPLGGLHACLQAAQNRSCLVLGVDIPLVPLSALAHIRRMHHRGVTVLAHNGYQELLLGMYDSNLANVIEPMIQTAGVSVHELRKCVEWNTFSYKGPEEFLKNCNWPQDYICVCETAIRYENADFSLF